MHKKRKKLLAVTMHTMYVLKNVRKKKTVLKVVSKNVMQNMKNV